MKKQHIISQSIIISLLLFIVFNVNCKKTNDEEIPQTNCSKSSFKVKVSESNLGIADIVEDAEGNIYLYGKTPDSCKLIKLDTLGSIIWNKNIPNSLSPIEITLSDNNSIILLSEGNSQQESCDVLFEEGIVQIGLYNCEPTYDFLPSPVTCTKFKNEVKLIKMDSKGTEVWSKVLPDFYPMGNSLTSNSDGDIFLMTMDFYGHQPEYIYDNTGNLTDTVNYPFNENNLTLYNINKNGVINWERQIANVRNDDWFSISNPGSNFANVGNSIIIKTRNEIITVDNNGTEVDRFELMPDNCLNTLYYLEDITNDQYLISGGFDVDEGGVTERYYYTELRSIMGEIIWNRDEFFQIVDAENGCLLIIKNASFIKYDLSFEMLWSYEVDYLTTAILSCNGGAIISSYTENGTFITRLNENGVLK